MKDIFKSMSNHFIFTDVLYIIIGLILIILPKTVTSIISIALGIIIFISGIVHIISYFCGSAYAVLYRSNLIVGIFIACIGAFLIFNPKVIASILPYILGVVILIDGVGNIQKSLDLKKMHYSNWMSVLLSGLVTIVLGIILLTNPFAAAVTLTIFIGCVLVIVGLINIWVVTRMAKTAKNLDEDINSVIIDMDDYKK